MRFMCTWMVHEDKREEVLKVWSSLSPEERGDAGPGVTIIGRWHNLVEMTGVAIVETESAAALSAYLLKWNPYMDMDIAPVLDDEESAAVGKAALGI